MQYNHVEIWDKVLAILKEEVHPNTLLTWFRPIRPLKMDEKSLTIQVPNQFSYEWIEQQYGVMMNQALSQVMGNGFKLAYSIRMDSPLPAELTVPPPSYTKPLPVASGPRHPDNLNSRYCFDSYVEGECNKFAKAAALAVAKSPGSTTFNPLVVYGGVGLGKTHLIQAIGNYAKEQNPATRVLYVDSERFTADFINSIQKNKTTEFSGLYRNVDILMIDDIQFFGNKERTQDEFFHTFNALHQKGKQIILSSDRPPKDLLGMEERLKSRFQWGLVVDIQPPDLETRQAILQKKAEESNIELPPEIFHFIATHITSNIRELEGAMIRLLAYASLNGIDITLEVAKKVLRDVCISKTKAISIEYIQKITAEHFSFPDDLLRSKTRKKEIAQARQICMYLCKLLTDSSLKTIGLHFGGRDHSTVIHAINCTEELIGSNVKFRQDVEAIRNRIEISQL
ncbi:MAG TPA: chromosomal replication initiator protein DnaA [bacterium]|nr:chromosomal replication initiator protein DnaA [bacterium]HQG46648.1 chromosomal replication initiator protein DnaA [bacterium]HQI47559.1 chromosomal replication initiator protein DnaA [bacterium]HQJ63335.1 chromosomal replication initiator protein DnaA [bacterium]